jgi:hypothetical protein
MALNPPVSDLSNLREGNHMEEGGPTQKMLVKVSEAMVREIINDQQTTNETLRSVSGWKGRSKI